VRGIWLVAGVVGLVLAGCGGSGDTSDPSAPSNPKPTLETRVNVGAVGFAVDDFRAGAETFLESVKSCFDLAGLGADSTSGRLCLRSAEQTFARQGQVVFASLTQAGADAPGACRAQLLKVGKGVVAASHTAQATALAIVQTDDANSVSASLDAFDRSFNRLDGAYSRAQDLCGG
jgi:hypothetical protein